MPTNKMYLPDRDSEEGKSLYKEYPTASVAQLDVWTRKCGYKSRDNFVGAMRVRYGLVRELNRPVIESVPGNLTDVEKPSEIIKLPPVKLREYKAKKRRRGDEETMVLLASDGHAGKITKSFNKEVYRRRMETMFDSTMVIANLHRNMYPINKLRILNLGDNVQGENPYQGSKVGEIEMGARDQTIKIATPIWNDILGSFKQNFSEVIFEGIGGNHGHERFAPETSREDFRLYDILQAGIGQQKGITINIHEDFYAIINIQGFRFFATHLDGIPCYSGIPLFAIDRRIKAWHIQYGGFSYAVGGHFHRKYSYEIARGIDFFMCSTLVSDDDWALKKLGVSSAPSQLVMGVHPTMGVTWRYPLVVDRDFLIERLPDVYGGEK